MYFCSIFVALFGLAVTTVSGVSISKNDHIEHKMSKRNFVPNRFDIVDNEIKHSIQKEVANELRKNFIPNNPLLEDSKWGRSSPAKYPENQPSKIYGMEYDDFNPSRSDPGYLVLDLKQLAEGRLKFHEQKVDPDGRRKAPVHKAPAPKQPKYNGYQQQSYQPQQQQNYQQQNDQQQQYYQQQQQPQQQQQQQQYYQQQQPEQQQTYQNYQQQPNSEQTPSNTQYATTQG